MVHKEAPHVFACGAFSFETNLLCRSAGSRCLRDVHPNFTKPGTYHQLVSSLDTSFAAHIYHMEMNTPAGVSVWQRLSFPLGLQLVCLSVEGSLSVLLQQQHTERAELLAFFFQFWSWVWEASDPCNEMWVCSFNFNLYWYLMMPCLLRMRWQTQSGAQQQSHHRTWSCWHFYFRSFIMNPWPMLCLLCCSAAVMLMHPSPPEHNRIQLGPTWVVHVGATHRIFLPTGGLHEQFWFCDLPASLEDFESQRQVISICEDVFFEPPVLRFSMAMRGAFQNEHDTVQNSDSYGSGVEKGNINENVRCTSFRVKFQLHLPVPIDTLAGQTGY